MPRCPLCKTQTELVKYEGVPVQNCGTCGGYWVTKAKLDVILAKREVVMPEAVQRKMVEIADAANSVQELWCMTCGTAMRREQFKYWPDIQLDRCPKCKGIWLDRGELEKCQIYWEYVQDHPESPDANRAQRLAALGARWEIRKTRLRQKVEDIGQAARAGVPPEGILADLLALDADLDPGPEV